MPILRRSPYAKLEKVLGYRFRRTSQLEMALLHRSYRFESPDVNADNQRLEFLGDAVLGFLTAAHLFTLHEEHDEGFLTTLRSQVTSGKALAELAAELGVGEYLKMGKGERGSGGHMRESTLADAMESVLGAVYLDGGVKAAQKVFNKVFVPLIDGLSGDVWEGNPKGKLQEVSQRRWRTGPHYHVVRRAGPAHAAMFTVEVTLPDGRQMRGHARNKQGAEAHAAAQALKVISHEPVGSRSHYGVSR
jgi:ribonuclease-3